jgi:Rrf2 family transcriptional regulator, iron-sulfur cluster assembly transcription factor
LGFPCAWRVLDNPDRQTDNFNEGRPTQVKDIAERQGIPPRFLEQIFQDLKRAGLVGSKRGPQGGYSLLRAPTEVSLGDVLRVTEGPVALSEEVPDDAAALAHLGSRPDASRSELPRAEWPRPEASRTELPRAEFASSRNVTESVLDDVAVAVQACFDRVTLGTLCDRAEALGMRRPGSERQVYVI